MARELTIKYQNMEIHKLYDISIPADVMHSKRKPAKKISRFRVVHNIGQFLWIVSDLFLSLRPQMLFYLFLKSIWTAIMTYRIERRIEHSECSYSNQGTKYKDFVIKHF